jgi:hypothetical protein
VGDAEVAAVLQPVGADHRQGDVMADARRDFGRGQVASGRLEEVHRRLGLERRRIGDVDDHFGAGQRFGQALAGDRVHAGVG